MKVFVCVLVLVALCQLGEGRSPAKSHRNEKFFSIFNIIRFINKQCTHEDLLGMCYPLDQCTKEGGSPMSSTCAAGYGKCCVFKATACDSKLTKNVGYIMDPAGDSDYSTQGSCKYTIEVDDDTVQVRLDFMEFDLNGPTDGVCTEDRMMISGNDLGDISSLCGSDMSGQHMYIPVEKGNDINFNFMMNNNVDKRNWKIRYTKLTKSSDDVAPEGCRQYFTGTSGTVTSFNYDTTTPGDSVMLADQMYTVCVKQESGFSRIRWEVCDDGANNLFDLTTTDDAAADDVVTTCLNQYVLIPGGHDIGATKHADRHCGNKFNADETLAINAPVESEAMPFVMYVKNIAAHAEIKGFCLKYTQQV